MRLAAVAALAAATCQAFIISDSSDNKNALIVRFAPGTTVDDLALMADAFRDNADNSIPHVSTYAVAALAPTTTTTISDCDSYTSGVSECVVDESFSSQGDAYIAKLSEKYPHASVKVSLPPATKRRRLSTSNFGPSKPIRMSPDVFTALIVMLFIALTLAMALYALKSIDSGGRYFAKKYPLKGKEFL